MGDRTCSSKDLTMGEMCLLFSFLILPVSFFSLPSVASQGCKPTHRKLTEMSCTHFANSLSRGCPLQGYVAECHFVHLLAIRWGHYFIYLGDTGGVFPQERGGGFWHLGYVQVSPIQPIQPAAAAASSHSVPDSQSC